SFSLVPKLFGHALTRNSVSRVTWLMTCNSLTLHAPRSSQPMSSRDVNTLPGDIICFTGGQKGDSRRYILRSNETLQCRRFQVELFDGLRRLPQLFGAIVNHPLQALAGHRARIDYVDLNIVRAHFLGQCHRKTDQAPFGYSVRAAQCVSSL